MILVNYKIFSGLNIGSAELLMMLFGVFHVILFPVVLNENERILFGRRLIS